jgi:hypothetical protein
LTEIATADPRISTQARPALDHTQRNPDTLAGATKQRMEL